MRPFTRTLKGLSQGRDGLLLCCGPWGYIAVSRNHWENELVWSPLHPDSIQGYTANDHQANLGLLSMPRKDILETTPLLGLNERVTESMTSLSSCSLDCAGEAHFTGPDCKSTLLLEAGHSCSPVRPTGQV